MLPSWPDFLPLPKLSAYGVKNDNSVLRTAVEGGPERQRRVFSQITARVNSNFTFNNIEYAVFRVFFKQIINDGADFFTIDLDLDNGLTQENARFVGTYKGKKISNNYWTVDSVLEVDNPTTLDDELFELILALGEEAVENLEQIALILSELEELMVFFSEGFNEPLLVEVEEIAVLLTELEVLMASLS